MRAMPIRSLRIFVTAVLICCGSLSGVAAPSQNTLDVPDTTLLDQNGREVRFKTDVLGDKTVAIQFIFTTCRAICPVLGAAFAKVQDRLGDRLGKDISLVSVSIDPVTDTPARMKQWGEQFGARPGWTLLTGEKEKIENLLKALDASNHNAPVVLLGNLRTGEWIRSYDEITAPEKLYTQLINLADKPSPAQKYFGSTVLIDQNGEKLRLYDDLMKGKVVVVNAFFSTCQGVCSVTMPRLAQLQAVAGERLGKDVSFVSISVDPLTDTPAKLKNYAQGLGAKPGWHLLTGDREAVEQTLSKFGQYVEVKENHSNLLIIGNDRTGLWKKVLGLSKAEDIAASFRSVLNDETKPGP
jgi:cytochrome oxidase Cu insertion factor (SCO1/SenC/PrrC family)